MKKLNNYINEKLVIGNNIDIYNYHPKDKKELKENIKKKINKEGLGTKDNPLDLNDIDTSKITDMSNLFDGLNGYLKKLSCDGYFDISKWNVSNVEDMSYMFFCSKFNGDISNWDVSNVEYMQYMFASSEFNGNINKWDVSNVKNMRDMFCSSKFDGDISSWNISNVKNMFDIFAWSPLENNPPKWYLNK